MAFTVWSFPWSSLWGGGIEGEDYDPLVPPDPDQQVISGTLWIAQDEAGTASVPARAIQGADTMGWAPGNMPEFDESGSITLIAYGEVGDVDIVITRSDSVGDEVQTSVNVSPGPVHAELFGNIAVTGFGGDPIPSFVMFSVVGGALVANNIPLTDLTSINTSTVWANELGKTAEELRYVSLETHGTVIVAMDDSTLFPDKAFFLKSTFGSGSGLAAKEILVDLRPSEAYEVVQGRFHVVETHNRVFLFYYEVREIATGGSHLAFFAYTPVHPTFDDDLTYNSAGIVQPPAVVLPDHRPIDSTKGARRHQVSNALIIGVEPADTTDQGLQIHWYTSHGYGYTSFGPPAIWDKDEHPFIFGGRLSQASMGHKVRIVSVGWADPHHGGTFPVVATLEIGEIFPAVHDFLNFYRTDTPANATFKRVCLGALYAPRVPFDSNPAGRHSLRYSSIAPIGHNEYARGGYHTMTDYLAAKSYLKLDEVNSNVTPATVGSNGITSGGVVLTTGIVKSALYFYGNNGRVEVPGSDATTQNDITLSLWVFPETVAAPSASDDKTIALQDGGDDVAWRLRWQEDSSQFHWRVSTIPGGAKEIDSSALGALPTNHWYHVTATYNQNTLMSQLYINGFLVDEIDYLPGSILGNGVTNLPIVLGFEPNIVAWDAFRGRLDDVVVGAGREHDLVLASYHYGLLSEDGLPMRGARTAEWRYQDQIISTVSAPGPSVGASIYTLAMRRVNMSPHPLLRNQLVIDVWKVPRGLAPEFMGMVTLPGSAHHRTGGALTEQLAAPTNDDLQESFEMKLVRAHDFSGPSELWHLFYYLRSDPTNGPTSAHLYHDTLDLDNPSVNNTFGAEIAVRLTGDERMTAMDAIVRVGAITPHQLTLVFHVYDGAAVQHIYLLNSQDFGVGALAAANKRDMANFLPSANTDGSFSGRDYAVEFGAVGSPPLIRGIVGRAISPGLGFPNGFDNGVQLIFGLESVAGGSNSIEEQLVSTLHVILEPGTIDTPEGGDFLLPDNGLPRQLDEYGVGGVDPFLPLSWLPNPMGVTGDSIILARRGNRNMHKTVRDGHSGLMLYVVPRQGNHSIKELALVGPEWNPSTSKTIGASAALNIASGAGDTEPVQIYVSRLFPDRTDKFSTLYVSAEEATSGQWSPADVTPTIIPVLRRNDRFSTVLWTGHLVLTRYFTFEETGMEVKVGAKYNYAVTLRWSFPGSTSHT